MASMLSIDFVAFIDIMATLFYKSFHNVKHLLLVPTMHFIVVKI